MRAGGHVGGGRSRTVERTWPDDDVVVAALRRPRDDVVLEHADAGGDRYEQAAGPFLDYERRLARQTGPGGVEWRETTSYRWSLPWFAWLFTWPLRWAIARRGAAPGHADHHALDGGRRAATARARTPWWAPPDRLDPRQLAVLGLLAAASRSSAFVNTLFTQTVQFAADEFGVAKTGVGVAGAVVRAGIVFVLPVAVLADRIGRRRVITAVAIAAPLISALGALAPSFPFLVATQTIGRPIGLALDFLVAVVAAEEMPRNSRAYAVSVLAMASGLGAGIAVIALPLADVSASSWRLVYVVTLVWLAVAVSIARHLPETARFQRPHAVAPRLDRGRFAVLAGVAFLGNLFVAPASLFQNGYLQDVRGFSALSISIFTLTTATPAGLGLIVGGRIADVSGRRRVIAVGVPASVALVVVSYSVGGPVMWLSVFGAGAIGGLTFPALAVYRTELFPTGNRSRAAGLITAAALLGGIGGLLVMGRLLDAGWSHGRVMALLALAEVAVVAIVVAHYPETAHRELEELNPVDAVGA